MEPPISLDARDLRDRKVDVLRSIRPLSDDEVVRHTRRACYTSGRRLYRSALSRRSASRSSPEQVPESPGAMPRYS
jgi:glucose-6-phosphate 1-dehydrogenase